MNAAEIAQRLGSASHGKSWSRCRCPVHGGRSASLALKDTVTGVAVKCFAGCSRWHVMQELARRGLVAEPAGEPKKITADSADERQRIARARDIWGESYPAHETTQIGTYFRSRGILLPAPATIRIHGLMRHSESDEERPAMVARIDHVTRGHTGTHLTFLAVTGECKATVDPNRKMIGVVSGGAVRLAPIQLDGWLVIGEGIESTLSAMQMARLPGWAALSAGGIEKLVLPPEARAVLIAADHDENRRGEEAARYAAERWVREGRRVRISKPPNPGQDFNDLLLSQEAMRDAG